MGSDRYTDADVGQDTVYIILYDMGRLRIGYATRSSALPRTSINLYRITWNAFGRTPYSST